jgi:hypothetical protein
MAGVCFLFSHIVTNMALRASSILVTLARALANRSPELCLVKTWFS